jgi:hypothetical protein
MTLLNSKCVQIFDGFVAYNNLKQETMEESSSLESANLCMASTSQQNSNNREFDKKRLSNTQHVSSLPSPTRNSPTLATGVCIYN